MALVVYGSIAIEKGTVVKVMVVSRVHSSGCSRLVWHSDYKHLRQRVLLAIYQYSGFPQ